MFVRHEIAYFMVRHEWYTDIVSSLDAKQQSGENSYGATSTVLEMNIDTKCFLEVLEVCRFVRRFNMNRLWAPNFNLPASRARSKTVMNAIFGAKWNKLSNIYSYKFFHADMNEFFISFSQIYLIHCFYCERYIILSCLQVGWLRCRFCWISSLVVFWSYCLLYWDGTCSVITLVYVGSLHTPQRG